MLPEYEISLLLSLFVGFLAGFVAWGFWRVGAQPIRAVLTAMRDNVLVGLSVLAALALGGALTYALLVF
jgi:hypothetical protein